MQFLKCKCAKLTEFYQTYSNVTLASFILSKTASLTENVQDFTGQNILCHIKSYVYLKVDHKIKIIQQFFLIIL